MNVYKFKQKYPHLWEPIYYMGKEWEDCVGWQFNTLEIENAYKAIGTDNFYAFTPITRKIKNYRERSYVIFRDEKAFMKDIVEVFKYINQQRIVLTEKI